MLRILSQWQEALDSPRQVGWGGVGRSMGLVCLLSVQRVSWREKRKTTALRLILSPGQLRVPLESESSGESRPAGMAQESGGQPLPDGRKRDSEQVTQPHRIPAPLPGRWHHFCLPVFLSLWLCKQVRASYGAGWWGSALSPRLQIQ